MASFNNLPNEIILLVPQHLSERDLNSLSRASRSLHALLDPVLYTQHVRSRDSWALTWAALYDRVGLIKRLQALGADLITTFKNQPLHCIAAQHGSIEVVKMLLSAEDGDPTWFYPDHSVLYTAAWFGHAEIVALYLADPRLDSFVVNGDALAALRAAAKEAHPCVLEVLLRDGRADLGAVDTHGRTLLHWAASSEELNVKSVEMLLANPHVDRFRLDHDNRSALHSALLTANPLNFGPLLDAGLDPNERDSGGVTPFACAAMRRSLEPCLKLLRTPGVDVNAAAVDGNTPLIQAVRRGSPEVVAALASDERVLPNLARLDGMTALMLACHRYGTSHAVKTLLQRADLDLTLTDREGRTALHIAIQMRRYESIEMLCEKGKPATLIAAGGAPSLDSPVEEGRNAMSYAAAEAPESVIRILLEIEREVEGIDWMRPDRRGRDPAWYARKNGRHDIADLLEEGRDLGVRERPSMSSSESGSSSPVCTLSVSESD